MNITPAVEELFHQLADLDSAQRSRYFDDHPTDPAVRRMVEDLLASDRPTDSTFHDLVQGQVGAGLDAGEPPTTGAFVGHTAYCGLSAKVVWQRFGSPNVQTVW